MTPLHLLITDDDLDKPMLLSRAVAREFPVSNLRPKCFAGFLQQANPPGVWMGRARRGIHGAHNPLGVRLRELATEFAQGEI